MSDEHIDDYIRLPSPNEMAHLLPTTPELNAHVHKSRSVINDIIDGKDKRLLMVIGPCSIHDTRATLEYARLLADWAIKHNDQIFVVMRTYFEKPRTITGWKGMLYDPDRNDKNDIYKGIITVRSCLIQINALGLPCACEFLDPNMPQYYADLISWGAIGARTTESQIHRQMASGLSCPIGFKNSTSGSIKYPMNSIRSCAQSHIFPGIDRDGRAAIVKTTGNSHCHIILRGSDSGPNYMDFEKVGIELVRADLPGKIMVDCSHGNSGKSHIVQQQVWMELLSIIETRGCGALMGLMIESFLKDNNCLLSECDHAENYGRSVTDKCINWSDTLKCLNHTYMVLKKSTP